MASSLHLQTAFCQWGGVAFGAQFNTLWQVESGYIETSDELCRLRRSKYVQSNNHNAYKNVLKFLKEGRTVLFTGNPCQCLALRKFLHRDFENLYIVDVVCHGVPSPMVWERYLNEVSNKFDERKEEIVDIKFKYKDNKKYIWRHPGFRIDWKDGKTFEVFSNETSYENGYLGNLFVRPSCHSCKIKSLSSSSDITIGDFWGVEDVCPSLFDDDGVSIALIQTEKGQKLFDAVKDTFTLHPISIEDATKHNQRIVVSPLPHRNRNSFFEELSSDHSIDNIVNKCLAPNKKSLHYVKGQLIKHIKSIVKH